MNKPTITRELLWELLDYDPDTGVLIWKERKTGSPYWRDQDARTFNTRYAGKQAGALVRYSRSGLFRRSIKIFQQNFRSYRIIWVMMTGEWPKEGIDHIDQDSTNDKWQNLREATHSQNAKNLPMSKANNSGHVGVSKKKNGRYRCRIQVNGVEICTTCETEKEAIAQRKKWNQMYGFTENHGRVKGE